MTDTYTPHTKAQAMILMMATLGTDAQPTATMTAKVRSARLKLLPCQECGELHAAASLDGSTGLCEICYDLAGMENEHSDGHHDVPNLECRDCAEGLTA
jgi:recombinational DNA repair protein RecR